MVQKRVGYRCFIPQECLDRREKDICAVCGVEKRRSNSWTCSSKCAEIYWKNYYVANSWASVREEALKRDKYRCVKCGKQETEIKKLGRELEEWMKNHHSYLNIRLMTAQDAEALKNRWVYMNPESISEGVGKEYVCDELNHSNLTGDHIIPIALGGEEFDLNNVQTLCRACHKIKTRKDIKAIADLRFVEKRYVGGQKPLTVLPKEMIAVSQ